MQVLCSVLAAFFVFRRFAGPMRVAATIAPGHDELSAYALPDRSGSRGDGRWKFSGLMLR